MAIPAGDVGRVEAGHGFGLDDEVLEDLVEGGAQVDVAVGVGRAVVQDVSGAAGAGGANLARRDPRASQRSSSLGSACGRLAFMEKSVCGRLTVCFRSTLCESIFEGYYYRTRGRRSAALDPGAYGWATGDAERSKRMWLDLKDGRGWRQAGMGRAWLAAGNAGGWEGPVRGLSRNRARRAPRAAWILRFTSFIGGAGNAPFALRGALWGQLKTVVA